MIEESGEFCSMTMEAPCIMGDGEWTALNKPEATTSVVGVSGCRLVCFVHCCKSLLDRNIGVKQHTSINYILLFWTRYVETCPKSPFLESIRPVLCMDASHHQPPRIVGGVLRVFFLPNNTCYLVVYNGIVYPCIFVDDGEGRDLERQGRLPPLVPSWVCGLTGLFCVFWYPLT